MAIAQISQCSYFFGALYRDVRDQLSKSFADQAEALKLATKMAIGKPRLAN